MHEQIALPDKEAVREAAGKIVSKLFAEHAIPRLIQSGRLVRFGITPASVDIEETEAAALLFLLELPEKTVEMYKAGKIMTHVAIAAESVCTRERRHKKMFIPKPDIF